MNVKQRILNAKRDTNRPVVPCLVAVLVSAALFSARATDTSFNSLSIISTRNIFDPNRPHFQPPLPTPPSLPDSFALVGTMSYSKGKFAFFDGAKPEYRKVLEPGATIAGYTIKDVTPKSITLRATDGNEIAMDIGTQINRPVSTPEAK